MKPGRKTIGACVAALLLAALPAVAQTGDRPSAEPLAPELFEDAPPAPPAAPEPLLDALPDAPTQRPLASGLSIRVRGFDVNGVTVFPEEEVEAALAPFVGRELDTAELQDAVAGLTQLYIDRGYVTSGAYLPDQDVSGGIVTIEAVEGHLAEVRVEGNRWYRSGRIESRVRREVDEPLRLEDVERAIQLLIQEDVIERVAGRLLPGVRRGEAVLELRIEEELPFELDLGVANDKPPPIGSLAGHVYAADKSLVGWGDTLEAWFAVTGALFDGEMRYKLPVNAAGTELLARFRGSSSKIIEDPIASAVDIDASLYSGAVGARHPVYHTPRDIVWLGLLGEWRRSRTFLEGEGFPFSTGVEADGRATVSVLRLVGEWINRTRRDVLAARAIVSVGTDVLGATENPKGLPDAQYVALLGQFQWAHRFSERLWNTQLIVRGDVQYAFDPLFPMEQIAVGGARTVRGYRENQFVRDSGVIGSVELRVPVWRNIIGGDVLYVAPFGDVAHVWSHPDRLDLAAQPKDTIASLGLGLRYDWRDRVQLRVYWGGRLLDVRNPHNDLQDYGVNLGLKIRAL